MADQQEQSVGISAPSLPKGGGAIQSIGKGWGAVGPTGAASFEIPLPITSGRGHAPSLGLAYQSSVGNGLFGLGWSLNLGYVSRRASKGVPLYNDDDVILGPGGDVWLAQRDGQGATVGTNIDSYYGLSLSKTYRVVRYFPRIEGAFDRIEHWSDSSDNPGFWLVHGADGSLALYGFNQKSRIADPAHPDHVAQWLLEETMNAHGEHVLYEYKAEDGIGLSLDPSRDVSAQRYLTRVRYGNFSANEHLYFWQPDLLAGLQWHFNLVFDYGERGDISANPPPGVVVPWQSRADGHVSFAYGFELGSWRFVHHVLMYHCFPDEIPASDSDPAEGLLVSALAFGYTDLQQDLKVLSSVQSLGWTSDAGRAIKKRPPVMFTYQDFDITQGRFTEFESMAGLNDGQRYQLLDIYGEGLPGVLYREDKGWLYREPIRDPDAHDPDAVRYGPWQLLPNVPVADAATQVRQSLADLTGDGRLDWVVAQPGMAGFYTLNPDRSWSSFVPFSAFPTEFFHPQGQLADLVGDGLSDLVLIGPRSVRLYASRQSHGFAQPSDVERDPDEDRLPLQSNAASELVAFADLLGSGQQHLVRIRHNAIWCWANLGRGRFGKGQHFADLPFTYLEFDPANIRLADMDGSGAVDLVYLKPEGFQIFMNKAGNGLADPVEQPWPPGVRYDRFSQVSMTDLQGLGCSSLVLTVPHMKPGHWRFDLPAVKPYLLCETNNNMGALGTVTYRSSAQEWLDEKAQLLASGQPAHSELPFALHVVTRQTQLDEITGSVLCQKFSYRHGFYDGHEREFRGFGQVLQIDSEYPASGEEPEGFTAPVLTKSWFNCGRYPAWTYSDFNQTDADAVALGENLLTTYAQQADQPVAQPGETELREMARALAGSMIRVEVFGLEAGVPASLPFSIQSSRYLVRQLEAAGPYQPYARMMPLMLESVSYQYEGQADDPMCAHMVNLAWDEYGVMTHGVAVNYARRQSVADEAPFVDEHEQSWWKAAHDEAQQRYYLSENRAQVIHMDLPDTWLLGLPYLSRTNAMVVQAADLSAQQISYEQLKDTAGWFAALPRTLVSLSRQTYDKCSDGEANFEALPGPLEMAELDEHALSAYDRVMTREQLNIRLSEVGYQRMSCFLPDDPAITLWSVKRGFNTYAGLEHFYRVETFKPSASHGLTKVDYDNYSLMVTAVTAADGCMTQAVFDYGCLQPTQIIDPNQNTQEARYDAFAAVAMTSFYGTELGEPVGFAPLADAILDDLTPTEAISASTPTDYATASYYDAFSWMNDGEPVHSITLQWDRYPSDAERQQRMVLTSVDGFGRVLQTRQRVEPGKAWQVVDGQLSVIGDELVEVDAPMRWRVSERVEYNNKGLPVRVYRPYFTDSSGYVDDRSVRASWYHDKQLYDPLGRPTQTWTAKGWMRRITYRNWYTINEDENDTAEEVNDLRAAAGLQLLDDGSMSHRKKRSPWTGLK